MTVTRIFWIYSQSKQLCQKGKSLTENEAENETETETGTEIKAVGVGGVYAMSYRKPISASRMHHNVKSAKKQCNAMKIKACKANFQFITGQSKLYANGSCGGAFDSPNLNCFVPANGAQTQI